MKIVTRYLYVVFASLGYAATFAWIYSYRDVSDTYAAFYIDRETLEWEGEASLDYDWGDRIQFGSDIETRGDLAKLAGNWESQNLQGWWSPDNGGRWALAPAAQIALRLPEAKTVLIEVEEATLPAGGANAAYRVNLNDCEAQRAQTKPLGEGAKAFLAEAACVKPGALNRLSIIPVHTNDKSKDRIVRVRAVTLTAEN